MTTYINIFAGPGAGKSTLAADLFAHMKRKQYSVELVTEFAKDLVWENRQETLAIQPYVSAKQYRNLARLRGKVDYVITDSPILKDSVYARRYASRLPQAYHDLLAFMHEDLGHSVNILISRQFAYQIEGRYQDEKTAQDIDRDLKLLLHLRNVDFYECAPDIAEVMEAVYQG
jgi:nicotinamide riboside kinase